MNQRGKVFFALSPTVAALLATAGYAASGARSVGVLVAVGAGASMFGLALSAVWLAHEFSDLARDAKRMTAQLSAYEKSSLGQLLRTEQKLQGIIDGMADPMLVVSAESALLHVNRAAATLFGLTPNARPRAWAEHLPGELAQAVERARMHVASGRGPYTPSDIDDAANVELPSGRARYVARAVPSYGEDGAVAEVTVALHDVTRTFYLDERRADLVAAVAHEFRTPLTSIRMAIHLCVEGLVGPLAPKQADLLFTARDECERLQSIVEDLLAASRLNGNDPASQRVAISVELLLEAAIDDLRATAEAEKVRLRLEIIPGIGEVAVDREEAAIVLSNLIVNAIHHSPEGAVVTAGASRKGKLVEIEVRDHGPGIAPEFQTAVFEPYFQAPGGKPGGAGLGLSIAKRIVLEHDGTIGVESQAGAGARFWVRLPAVMSPAN